MSLYVEGDVPFVTNGNCNNGNNGWNDWSWIIGLALVGGLFGNGGFGFGGGFGGGRGGYGFGCCGTPATQADLAAGFNNSAVLSSLNDIKLGQSQAINYNNQGFSGLNATINAGFSGVDNAICTLGYQNQAGINQISNLIQSCCCDLKTMNLENRYLNEKQTCDILAGQNAQTRAILDYLTSEKISSLQAENSGLKAQISNDKQSAFIIDSLAPKCPQPAYVVQPPQQVTFPTNCCGNVAYANYGYGNCGASIQ